MKALFWPAALVGFFIIAGLPALAAEAAPVAVDLRPLIDTASQVLIGLLSGAGLWLVRIVAAKLKIQADAQATAALERAILNGITLGGHKVAELAAGKVGEVFIRNALVGEATKYVIGTMPDTVKRFGLTQEKVQDLVLSRLPPPSVAPRQEVQP